MPAVFDSSGPVREMFENFAPQVKLIGRRNIAQIAQTLAYVETYPPPEG